MHDKCCIRSRLRDHLCVVCPSSPAFSPPFLGTSWLEFSLFSAGSEGLHLGNGRWRVIRMLVVWRLLILTYTFIIPSSKFQWVSVTSTTCRRWTIYPLERCTETVLKAEGYLLSLLRHAGETNFQSWARILRCCSQESSPTVLTGRLWLLQMTFPLKIQS